MQTYQTENGYITNFILREYKSKDTIMDVLLWISKTYSAEKNLIF